MSNNIPVPSQECVWVLIIINLNRDLNQNANIATQPECIETFNDKQAMYDWASVNFDVEDAVRQSVCDEKNVIDNGMMICVRMRKIMKIRDPKLQARMHVIFRNSSEPRYSWTINVPGYALPHLEESKFSWADMNKCIADAEEHGYWIR